MHDILTTTKINIVAFKCVFLKNSTLWGMYSIDMMVILSTYIKKTTVKVICVIH